MNQVLRLPGFTYFCDVLSPTGRLLDSFEVGNLIPQQAIDYVAGTFDGNGSIITNWYVGLFKNGFTPVAGTTAAQLPTTVGEFVGYSEAARPAWNAVYDNLSRLDNQATVAEFTLTQDTTLYGAFIVSNSTKGGGSGTLLSIARFPSPKQMENGSTFKVRAGIDIVAG